MWGLFKGNNIIILVLNLVKLLFCEVCLLEIILLNCIKFDYIVICLYYKRRRILYVIIIIEIYGSIYLYI